MNEEHSYKIRELEDTKIIKIQRFLKSSLGFRIGVIIIGLVILASINFGLIFLYILGDILNIDILTSYVQQQWPLSNNEVTSEELNVLDSFFRIGFGALMFGIIIGILSVKTGSQPDRQTMKSRQKYLALILISIGILLIVFSLIIPF